MLGMAPSCITVALLALSIAPISCTPALRDDEKRAIEERAGCNQDNVLRALIDPRYSSSATIFCSAFISVPASTVTGSTSTVLGGTVTASTTSIADPVITTITPTVTSTSIVSTLTSTVYTTYRAPDEGPDPTTRYPQKRDIPLPTYVSGYPSSRVSSACSCITIPVSTSTVKPAITVPATTTTVTSVISPDPTTVTGSPTTVVVTSTKTSYRVLPTLCDPVNFKDYRDFIDRRRYDYRTVPGTTKQDCCLTCYNAQNCLSFIFNPANKDCSYYTGNAQTDFTYKVDICPLGITSNSYQEVPGWKSLPQNYGPCLEAAPLGNH